MTPAELTKRLSELRCPYGVYDPRTTAWLEAAIEKAQLSRGDAK